MKAKHSQMNLNVPEASTNHGTQIIQWKQPGALNEQWEYVGDQDGWYLAPHHSIRNRWSRQCLAVDSKADGAPVVQRPCDGTAGQKWDFTSASGGYGYWTNYWSGLDLNVVGASTQLGAKLMQYHRVAGAANTLFATVSDNANHVE